MSAYKELKEIFLKNSILTDIDNILQWDLSTMMPKKARKNRAKQMSFLNRMKFDMLNNNTVVKLFEQVDISNLNFEDTLNFKQMKKEFLYFRALPKELIDKKILISTNCEGNWRKAKKESKFNIVKNDLEKLVNIVKEESNILSDFYQCSRYDALLKKYEESYSYDEIRVFFNELTPFLQKAYKTAKEKQKQKNYYPLTESLSEKQQFSLAHFFMKKLGFDFGKGRLDISPHPFCGGGIDDIRITTRIDKSNTFSFFEAIIHETGHALYELGLPTKWKHQPAGKSGGMALHESQSLFYEMHVFKSIEFKKYFSAILEKKLNLTGKVWEAENLNLISNLVNKQYIRVDADEITYPLHVLLRLNIEHKIIEQDLKVSNLPEVWNEEFNKIFNFKVNNDSNGCLQDIHWFTGDFGYFPTYTLGAMIAAQINFSIQENIPDFKKQILRGNFSILKKWLSKNIHKKASFFNTKEIIKQITNNKLKSCYFIDYITSKYLN